MELTRALVHPPAGQAGVNYERLRKALLNNVPVTEWQRSIASLLPSPPPKQAQ